MPESEQEQKDGGSAGTSARGDLHCHTTFSDGVHSPREVLEKARAVGLSALAITDHDHVGAIDEAIEWGNAAGIEIVPGLELSATLGEKDVHLLAYFFDHHDRNLLDYLTFFRHERLRRAERIVKKLNDINIPLKMDAVLDQAGIGSVGRPHIANALVEGGLTDTYHAAFEKYLGNGAPAYERKYQVSPAEAVRLIAAAGGLSFLAHPGKYTTEVELLQLIKDGLDGIEVVHPSHNETRQLYYRAVVNQYFLLETGGSDFHGGKKNDDYAFGAFTVPYHVVEAMRSRLFS
jgi:predicted metal-dependent phosphoesterase TrpH